MDEGESADKMEVVDLEKGAPANKKGFTEEDVYQHGNWVIDQIQNFLGMHRLVQCRHIIQFSSS